MDIKYQIPLIKVHPPFSSFIFLIILQKPQNCQFSLNCHLQASVRMHDTCKCRSHQPMYNFTPKMLQTTQLVLQPIQSPFNHLQLPATPLRANSPQFQVFKPEFTKCPINFKVTSFSMFLVKLKLIKNTQELKPTPCRTSLP